MQTLMQRMTRPLALGRLPGRVRAELEAEGGILYLAEGIAATAILRRVKTPSLLSLYRRSVRVGFFALSPRKIVARAGRWNGVTIDLPYHDPRFQALSFMAAARHLSVTFDASDFFPRASGKVEVRFHLPDVPEAFSILSGILQKSGQERQRTAAGTRSSDDTSS